MLVDRVREILEYDAKTGIFRWKVSRPKAKAGEVAGSVYDHGYVVITLDGQRYRAHRLAWLMVTGQWPKNQIDHRDGNRANNAFLNLREATNLQNKQNQIKANTNNRSGFLGVSFDASKGRFRARIRAEGKLTNLGSFKTAEEAHSAYLAAKEEKHQFSAH